MDMYPAATIDMRSVISTRVNDSDEAQVFDLMLKRAFDVGIAVCALVVLLPFLLVLAAVLKLTSRGPLLFAHRRLGKGGQTFMCLKFRSMVVNSQAVLAQHLAENPEAFAEWTRDHKLRNDPRITRIGQFIRRTSLDELPQLINVLRGEMSLVGPRPIVIEEVAKYGRYFSDYASVKPGLTGLWQVSGRNNVTYRRRVAIDCSYARNRNFAMDMGILLRTVPVILFGDGCF